MVSGIPWQYFPKPKISHRPLEFIYGFSLEGGMSRIEHQVGVTGILKPEKASQF